MVEKVKVIKEAKTREPEAKDFEAKESEAKESESKYSGEKYPEAKEGQDSGGGQDSGSDFQSEKLVLPNKKEPWQEQQKKMLIILQSGNEDGGRRATLAFAIGVSSVFTKVETNIFLMGNGVVWARKGEVERVNINGYEPLSGYFNSFVLNSGNLLVSTPCMQYQERVEAVLERRDIVASVQHVGLTTLAHLAQMSSVLTF